MADTELGLSPVRGEEDRVRRFCARVAHATDIGRRRHNNQDSHLVLPLPPEGRPAGDASSPVEIAQGRLLVAVADGMGGHAGGEVASRLCIENLAQEIVRHSLASGGCPPEVPSPLQKAVELAHEAIFARAQSEKHTMGTTLTAALLHGRRAELAQVGDSRAYLFREGNLILLTQDQTIGNELRKRGQNSALVDERIQEMLVQAVGAQASIKVVMSAVDLEARDLLLICCDGLHKVVPPADIVQTLELEAGLEEKAARLVSRANERGGPDNITVILAEICPAANES